MIGVGRLDAKLLGNMQKKYLITSALPYINGVKHLGNLIGSMLPADVFARFLRQEGHDVLYICGTDEHGTPAELAAQEADMPIEEYCAKMHEVQKQIYEGFEISFDYFGRTSSESNHALTTMIFQHLYDNGYIEEQYINQYYSPEDKRFLPDRYVEGECPHCGYDKARGDQCDKCGVLLDPEELIEPYSVISGSRNIALQQTQHFFLNMPLLEPQVADWVNNQRNWSDIVKGIARKWLMDGLKSRCISRDLKWGIKIPKKYQSDQTQEKVFYVWFDAPNGYISITQDWAKNLGNDDEWKKWWLPENADSVYYVEFMAKDNVPFHSVFWPAMLIGTKLPFKMVDDINGLNWLTYDKGKFSTSQKRGVFTDTALELFPADYWRYYLLAICPESADSDFTFDAFADTINKDLADTLGNFVSRTFALLNKYFDLKIPNTSKAAPIELEEKCKNILAEISACLTHRKFRQAVSWLKALWVVGNEYITEKEPWHVLKTDITFGGEILTHCVHLLRIFAIASAPFIPTIAKKIAEMLNIDWSTISVIPISQAYSFDYFPERHQLVDSGVLFPKIDSDTVAILTSKYSGE
jgi:methionyl-tRNA synthetase